MKELIDKFITIERNVSENKGNFYLFALFLREDAQDKWDILVSAPWIERNKKKAMEYLANIIQTNLNTNELLSLSRILIIETDTPELNAFQRAIHIEHGRVEVKDSNFFGLNIKHAFIITSNK